MFDPARWLLTPWASDLCSPYKEFECCSPNRDIENDTNQREVEVSLVPEYLVPTISFCLPSIQTNAMRALSTCFALLPRKSDHYTDGLPLFPCLLPPSKPAPPPLFFPISRDLAVELFAISSRNNICQ